MYVHNTLIYADSGDIRIVLLCSSSQEDLMENYCHPIVILFMLETYCCLYERFTFVKHEKVEERMGNII